MKKGIPHQTRAGSKSDVPPYKSELPVGVRVHYGVPVVEEEELEVEKPRPIWWCPECKSSQTYYRLKSNTQRCRACGCEWERVDLKETKNSP